MKKTLGFCDFCDFWPESRKDQFSYYGKEALFGYLEEYEEDTGEEIEFDPIALCCEYSEYENAKEAVKNYTSDTMTEEEALKYLEERTQVIKFDQGLIIQDF